MDEEVLLLLIAVVAIMILGPVLGIAAWVRIRRLERRGTNADFGANDPVAIRRIYALEARLAELESRVAGSPAVPRQPLETDRPRSAAPPWIPRTALPPRSMPLEERKVLQPSDSPTAPPEPAFVTTPLQRPSLDARKEGGFNLETLIAGRWLNRIGLLAVAIGVAYFLKLTIDNHWIGPTGQVALGALLGAGLLVYSSWLSKKDLAYFADGITGLGSAVFYLSCWAGGQYYKLFALNVAFVAMIVVTAATLAIAVGRSSQRVALLALVGGFLTPWLVSTGRDAQVALFTYIAVLNAGLLALTRMRDWRFIEVPAFVFTQLYYWGWYARFHDQEKLLSTAAFASLFFAQFALLPVLRSRRTGKLQIEQVALVLMNAGVFLLALQRLLWPHHRWMLTLAIVVLGAVHLLLARAVPRAEATPPLARLLFAGLALTFVTIAVPARLEGRWITMAWAIEGAVLMWTGFRIPMGHLRAAAFLLFTMVVIRLVDVPIPAVHPFLNARFATFLATTACFAFAWWCARRHPAALRENERIPFDILGVGINVLLLWALSMEVRDYFTPEHLDPSFGVASVPFARELAITLLWTLYATVLLGVGVSRGIAGLRWQGLALFGITVVKVFFFDLSQLKGVHRVISSIAVGVVLLFVSFLYQRKLLAGKRAPEP